MTAPLKCDWRDSILNQLQERNRTETKLFQDLILQHNKVFDNSNRLYLENLQLSIQNEKLKTEGGGLGANSSSVSDLRLQEKIQQLEQKLLANAEELTQLHRRKGENSQQIIDLNALLQEKEKLLATKDITLADNAAKIISLQAEVSLLEQSNKELKYLNDTLRDEHQALQLAFSSIEEKLRKIQDENRHLVERLIKYKAKDADRMNEENDNFLRNRYKRMQKEIEEACKETRGTSPEQLVEGVGPPLCEFTLPTRITVKFDAHEGEVSAVKWNPVDRLVATGGADRKLKLWDVSKGVSECKGSFVGSNAGVMAVDFDSSGTLILGASNDYATRVWTVGDQRLRHTLTGHSGKVMAAKFLGDASKVVTGSHDRTLKIWDLKSRACIETKFAGSSCNDVVTVDSTASIIISGHFDKSIRFWDSRSESSADNIVLNGKVTSLDLTKDAKYLVCCVRDDTLKLLDLRMNQVVTVFSCEGFKVSCDWDRATFSPDGQYVAVGSADGSVYIWGVASAKVEKILKEHGSAVTATAWCPFATYLAGVDRSRRAVIWSDNVI
ncbi:autophagy-related protein 16-1 [Anoplophora glabripennis]|uniref:autophagy-related protein 16-1 n=1 Tax=Anoplophora glabripennis TaxID=217634 RepID=UPI00087466EE|nr:autophagy-related protein 16-1 [Anoplophora glabripennis]XP_018564836.1 autophagy-related protein 16-1 [Anoplophora glabripennis]